MLMKIVLFKMKLSIRFRQRNIELKVNLFFSSGIQNSPVQGTPYTFPLASCATEDAGTC